MTDTESQAVITKVARAQVAELAPQEIPLFRATSQAFFADPDALFAKKSAGRDERLGFGAGEAVQLLTPFVLSAATVVFRFLAEQIKKSLQTESESVIAERIKAMFKRFHPDDAPSTSPPLGKEYLTQIHQLVMDETKRRGQSDEFAKSVADAIIVQMVFA